MDGEEYQTIRLGSVSEVIELYYQMLKSEMDISAKDSKAKTYDGKVSETSQAHLSEFAQKYDITNFSQILMELLTMLEWHNEKKSPPIQDTAIYNALLRLEKMASSTSSWELYGEDYDGSLIDISTFEIGITPPHLKMSRRTEITRIVDKMNMLEQNLSIYVVDILQGIDSETLFFPLTDFYQTDAIVKWRILEKISTIKVIPHETIYKTKLKEALTNKIEGEVLKWLEREFQKMKLSGKNTVLKDAEILTKILKELKSEVMTCIDIVSAEGSLFEATSCSYFDSLSKVIDEKLHMVCLQLMKAMDTYQEYHKTFHVNLRDSCALSHGLYRQIKSVIYCLQIGNKTSPQLQFKDYSSMFVKFFMNLLQVMKSECHHRIKRAVEAEMKDVVHMEERILSSSVIVLNCVCTVIDEWKHMEIEDEDLQIAFLIKIADIISDGAKIFAESLDRRLDNTDLQEKDIEFTKKICVIGNSVEHVREYLRELPEKMQWEDSLSKLDSSDMKQQILRILNLIHKSMNVHLQSITFKMMDRASSNLLTLCEKHLYSWLHAPSINQAYERVQSNLNEYLEVLNETIKENLFPNFLSVLWSSILLFIQQGFHEGEPPEYAETLKGDIQNFKEYFLYIRMEESDLHKPIFQEIMSLIELNSKSTVDLQLDYYSHVAESIVSPVEYLGHIAFQAGYKVTGDDVIDLYINVQKGQRLPARSFEMSELYVKLALCPSTLFPNHVPLKSMTATEELDNPIFNELFQFSKLPASVLSVKGAVVQVHVLNQDSTYSAEAVLLLKQIQNMSGFTSLEFLPVYLMPLKKFDMSQISFQVLENRSRWDKSAKHFINSRVKLSKGQKKLLPCIPGKTACFF